MGEDMEAQRGEVTFPRPHSWEVVQLPADTGLLDSRSQKLIFYVTGPRKEGDCPLLTILQCPLQVPRLLAQCVETSVQGGH